MAADFAGQRVFERYYGRARRSFHAPQPGPFTRPETVFAGTRENARKRINVHDDYELRYWSKEFGAQLPSNIIGNTQAIPGRWRGTLPDKREKDGSRREK